MSDTTLDVRVVGVSGLATCLVCSRLISWQLAWEDLERVAQLLCPACRGSCDVHVHTAHAVVEARSAGSWLVG